jgi:hypothetical protein
VHVEFNRDIPVEPEVPFIFRASAVVPNAVRLFDIEGAAAGGVAVARLGLPERNVI